MFMNPQKGQSEAKILLISYVGFDLVHVGLKYLLYRTYHIQVGLINPYVGLSISHVGLFIS